MDYVRDHLSRQPREETELEQAERRLWDAITAYGREVCQEDTRTAARKLVNDRLTTVIELTKDSANSPNPTSET
jgi:hypothetical protein